VTDSFEESGTLGPTTYHMQTSTPDMSPKTESEYELEFDMSTPCSFGLLISIGDCPQNKAMTDVREGLQRRRDKISPPIKTTKPVRMNFMLL
jgi:hypothetical protein